MSGVEWYRVEGSCICEVPWQVEFEIRGGHVRNYVLCEEIAEAVSKVDRRLTVEKFKAYFELGPITYTPLEFFGLSEPILRMSSSVELIFVDLEDAWFRSSMEVTTIYRLTE